MASRMILSRLTAIVVGLSAIFGGCTPTVFDPPLTSTIAGLDLAGLKEIQEDERLTTDEKREQIRTAIGAPNTPEGDRLVNFLLDLNIP
ncbi:MAG: hypothetical protein HZA51_17475 [Planctomycetes bacterium]|nr:hypothetical protein [Planctomycetota bacterium]